MKPIGISTDFILPGKVGGTEYHAKNLIEGFLRILDGTGETIRIFGGPGSYDPPAPGLEPIPAGLSVGNRFVREAWSYWKHAGSVRGMIFSNYATPPGPKPCPIVTVIHDAQYRHMPRNFSAKKRLWLRAAHAHTLMRADTVITTSEFVKRDLLALHGARWETKIKVIPIPVSWERFDGPEPIAGNGIGGRFILSVAAHYPHKNLSTLIKAFREVRSAFPDVRLVLAGQLPEHLIGTTRGADLRLLTKELGLSDAVVITGYITNRNLAYLYGRAEAFVFPSLFEGFGLPPVEAIGFGLPVITTACASIPEVTMGLGQYVQDPLDAAELSRRVCAVLQNPSEWKRPAADVERIRAAYAPTTIAKRYYDLLTP